MSDRPTGHVLFCSLVGLFLTAVPVHAIETFKTSNYGAGHQIWFEAEEFDERNPEGDQYFPVVEEAGAFGQAISRAGGAGGMIRWTFDVSAAGGKGGTWYFWARLIDPGNTSDYMLVEGDPGDPEIPTGPPFPGGDGAPFDNADDRVFEIDVAPSWGWTQGWDIEGHTKELQNGENTMYIFHRQGDGTVFWDVFMWTDDPDYVPTDEDYQNAVVFVRDKASNPSPANDTVDVPRDVVLSWHPGQSASAHDVYFGTVFEDVDTADGANGLGVLVSQGQTVLSYAPEGLLDFGQTYYWRVDAVSAAADDAISRGRVWSFTVEPYTYLIENITATASSAGADAGPENTINGSGLDGTGLHSDDPDAMWLTAPDAEEPAWIQFEFDNVHKLYGMQVWNYNVQFEVVLGYGLKDVTIEYSEDGENWTVLTDTEFAKGLSADGYASNTTVDMGGVAARFVRLTANDNWGQFSQYGLSEVAFTHLPVQAREPMPADGAQDVEVETLLNWRAGREVDVHEVYLSMDEAAVVDGTALADTLVERSYNPGGLNFGQTYYWKVVEVNEVEAVAAWDGPVWNFTTREYEVVDDFESYDNEDNAIYNTWIDGWVNGTGSTAGYLTEPFAETTIVNSGAQSMPLIYDNSISPSYSEVERDLGGLDLDAHGADTLRLFVAGQTPAFVETDDGAILMSAIGADIWNTADEFRYAYMNLSGDGSIVAQVDGLYRSNEWVKGGVMIRESVAAGSTFAAVYLTADYGVRYQARLGVDIAAVSDSSVATNEQIALQGPVWVKIERVGNAFNGYYSTDGENWTLTVWSPQTITMAADVTIGLALTSHDSSINTGAAFSGVATTGNVSGGWQTAEIGVPQPTGGNSIEPLYVALEDSAGKVAVVTHANAAAAGISAWQKWLIPYSDLAGINLNNVSMMYIGVGDRNSPTSGGAGTVYVDDIGFGKAVTAPQQ